MQTLQQLNEQFAIPDILKFKEAESGSGSGPGSGLTRAIISARDAQAVVYIQGAHVAHWVPRDARPVLFTSSRSEFVPGKAIRGGVPIIFPWFGGRGGGLPGPSHGFARAAAWRLTASEELDGSVGLAFALESDDVPDNFGYEHFALQFKVSLASELHMELHVRNSGSDSLTFEEALHSYFAVSDIEHVTLSGLEGTTCIDKTDAMRRKQVGETPLRISKETDQVHLNTQTGCTISDSGWKRRIVIDKSGSNSTVVWNPWIEKTRALKDMDPQDWRAMICVESGNIADDAITLAPGQSHVMRVVVHAAQD